MNCGVTMRGKVWSYGSREFYDPELGPYYQFVLKVPSNMKVSRGRTRVFIHWYKSKFRPEAKQYLECSGSLEKWYIQEIIDKPPQMCLTLVCWGDEVQLAPTTKPSK